MATNQESEPAPLPSQPVYYRWRDERSPYVVELDLRLVPTILADLMAGEQLGQEAGGILIGSFPRVIGLPTLRIEAFESVGRRGGDGLPYILVPEQRVRFTATRKKAATRELSAIGYFRSHLRTGPFELSLADRDLLAAEFKNSIHVALLVAKDQSGTSRGGVSSERYLGTFFVSINGIIQNRVEPVTFPFDREELERLTRLLSKLHLDAPLPSGGQPARLSNTGFPASAASTTPAERPTLSTGRRWAIGSLAAFSFFCVLLILWGWHRQGAPLTAALLPGSSGLELTVRPEGAATARRTILHIGWNQQCPLLLDATAGHLTITSERTHSTVRKLDLAPLELTAGRVDVELDDQPVEVSLALSMSDSTSVAQSAHLSQP